MNSGLKIVATRESWRWRILIMPISSSAILRKVESNSEHMSYTWLLLDVLLKIVLT